MNAADAAALFVVGLLGGVHCVGMCGGIVTALTVRLPRDRPNWRLHLAYQAGRLSTYGAAGALAGAAGSAALFLDALLPVRIAMFIAAQLMLIALGLYLLGITRYLAPFERAGGALWRRVQPAASRLVPMRTPVRAYAAGLLWGLIPCGLIYTVLATAFVSGSALAGAGYLVAFGAGTLPSLVAVGVLVPQMQRLRRAALARALAGTIVMAFGLVGLARAADLEHLAIIPFLCSLLTL